MPWELDAELRAIGVVEKEQPPKVTRTGRLPEPTGPKIAPGQEPLF